MNNPMRDWDVIEREQKLEKKYRRITKNAVYCLGGGLGLLLVKTFFPDLGGDSARNLMNGLAIAVIAYGLVMLTALVFLRSQLFKINFFMLFFVVPGLIIRVLVDTFVN